MEIARSLVVDAHFEDVFDYVADPRSAPAWRAAYRCVELEPPRRVAWEADDGARVVIELEQVWTATRVTERYAGPRRPLRGRALVRDLRALREALESQARRA